MEEQEKIEYIEEILSHIEGIIENVDRMTSGNFMHNKNSIKFSAKIIRSLIVEITK